MWAPHSRWLFSSSGTQCNVLWTISLHSSLWFFIIQMFSHLQINVRRHTILLGDEIISFMNVWNKPVCNWFICTREWAINFMMWQGTIIRAFVKSSLYLMTWWGYLRTVDMNILFVYFAAQWNVVSTLKKSCAVTPAPSNFSWCIQEISYHLHLLFSFSSCTNCSK